MRDSNRRRSGTTRGSKRQYSRYEQQRLERRQRQLVEILAGEQTTVQELQERRPEGTEEFRVVSAFELGVALTDDVSVVDTISDPVFSYSDADRGYGFSEYYDEFSPSWGDAPEDWDLADTLGVTVGAPQGQMVHSNEWPNADEYQVQVGYETAELAEMGCVAFWPMVHAGSAPTTIPDLIGEHDATSGTGNVSGDQLVGSTAMRTNPNTYSFDPTGTTLQSTLSQKDNTIAFWVKIDPTQVDWSTLMRWGTVSDDLSSNPVNITQMGANPGTMYVRWIADDTTDPRNDTAAGAFWARDATWTVPTQEWHFFTSTIGTDGIRSYWDATLQGTKADAPKPADVTGFFHLINGQMTASLGPAMVFNRALTTDEIDELYWDTNPEANSRLNVKHEEFEEYLKPVLFTDHDLNGGAINVKVIASPNTSPDGPANTETLDFNLASDEFYDLDWQADHKYFRINFSLAPSADRAATPVVRSFRLTTP